MDETLFKFPDSPRFTGVNAPSRIEMDLHDLEVVGEIPREIDGAFYRAAADHQFPPRFPQDSPFHADGMISMYRIKNGRASIRTRYAQTDKFKAERAAGRMLFGMYRNRHFDDPSVDPEMSRA